MKKETIEEAAEKYPYGGREGSQRKAFIKGAKWQEERSYSEKDMEIAFGNISTNWICFEEFIEQFKKI